MTRQQTSNIYKRIAAVILGILLVGTMLAVVTASEQGKSLIKKLMGNGAKSQSINSVPIDNAADNVVLSNNDKDLVQESLFKGKLEQLSENLLLFKYTDSDRLNGIANDFTYYQAGTYKTGEYAGYARIIATRPPEGPSDPEVFVLATKDFKSYVLDDPQSLVTKFPINDWQNPFSYLDQNKVQKTAVLPSEFPQTLSLNDNYVLLFHNIPTEYVEIDQKDVHGNQLRQIVIKQPNSNNKSLFSPFQYLQIFNSPFVQDMTYFDQLDVEQQQNMKAKERYFAGNTVVTLVDSVGLPAIYGLTTPRNIADYRQAMQRFNQEFQVYQRELDKYEQDKSVQYPVYPQYVSLPSLGFQGNQLKLGSNATATLLFKNYQTAIPGACAINQDTYTFALKDDELEQVGVIDSIKLYALKDKNHALYRLAYENKMSYFKQFPEEWTAVNEGMPQYSFEEYVKRQPLFFFKNYWQEWVGVGEFDIKLPGGCGKPVIYLYPQQTTNVTVRLDTSVQLTTHIPQYQNGWHVLAEPDGTLSNLSTHKEPCKQYEVAHFGAEYASQACQQNRYPYLFWAGNVRATAMPQSKGGWVVTNNQLNDFLSEKLTEMGFVAKEKNDFLSYWVPMMRRQAAPFYQISFLQTRELGMLFPMVVTPQPDTIFRIFMDYSPLQAMPDQLPTPQKLDRIERVGFTLIEWGGIKK